MPRTVVFVSNTQSPSCYFGHRPWGGWVFPPSTSSKILFANVYWVFQLLSHGSDGKESACNWPRFNPYVGKISWRREWLPTPVFLPGEFHEQKSLAGYCPLGHRESDTTEWLTPRNYWVSAMKQALIGVPVCTNSFSEQPNKVGTIIHFIDEETPCWFMGG